MQERPESVSNEFGGQADSVVQIGGNLVGDVTVHNHPKRTVPRWNLPAQRGFVNRVDELRRGRGLLQLDRDAPPRTVIYSGLPGVGKSATVQQLVGTSECPYEGGVLYLNLADFPGGRATSVDEALASCLRSFGVRDDVMPAKPHERRNLYREHTAENPVLVVLDEVTEPAQVKELTPSANGSAVLVTSNDSLTELIVDGAEEVRLEPLDPDSGAELLRERCGAERISAEPDAVAELVRVCGGLPAALRAAACQLVPRRRRSVADLVERMAAREQGLRGFAIRGEPELSSVFDVAYLELPQEQAQLYRRLALLSTESFGAELASVLVDRDAEEDAEDLVERCLLDHDERGYRVHKLVLRHAHDRLQHDESAQDRESAEHRLVRYFRTRAAAAERAVLDDARLRFNEDPAEQPFSTKPEALDWMDAHRAGVLEAVRLAEQRAWDDEAWQLAESASGLYLSRRHLADWLETSELGSAAARRAGRLDVVARLRGFASRALDDLGEHERAREFLDEAMPLAERSGNSRLIASTWELRGRHDELTDARAAISAYEHAIRLFEEAEDERGAAFVEYFLGRAIDVVGRSEQAVPALQRARERILALKTPDKRMAARALMSTGVAHHHLGQTDRAVAELREAEDILTAEGHSHYAAQADEALADVFASTGQRDREREALEVALGIYEPVGSPRVAQLRERLAGLGGS